jgi:hypothetical protein
MVRPKIAAVVTEHRQSAHAQHFVDRFLWGYPWHGRHHRPPMDLVSLYTDQVPEGDLSRDRARRFPSMKIYPTIAEALTLGGAKLAVDGVLLIGEHGRYPRNEKGQTLWPRYEFFQQIVDVYRRSGRTAPVFSDKHLSWKWEWAKEMVDTSKEMGFAFMAGSSVPVLQRIPPVEIPRDEEVDEVVCVALGGVDGYDIHALEGIQAMVERRKGGETGAVAMHALRGDAVFEAMKRGSWKAGGWDMELFETCLCRSQSLAPSRQGFNHILPRPEEIPALLKEEAIAYRYEYADGLKATMLLCEGLVGDFTFAARLKSRREPLSTLMYIDPQKPRHFFNAQVNAVEQMFLTGKPTYPIERTLLTTGLTAAGVESLWLGQKRIEMPHLAIRYSPTEESTFWRG